MFQDEPSDIADAIRWHRGLIEFYRMNMMRPMVGGDPVLCAGHQTELECHEQRVAELEAAAAAPVASAHHSRAAAR